MTHGLSCPKTRGISLGQGPNPCLLRWQVDSVSLSHEGYRHVSHLDAFFLFCFVHREAHSLDCQWPSFAPKPVTSLRMKASLVLGELK